ncbi:hypothetical protein [Streptomyces sp. KR55]|uniref:hypothetical protein n=1 Tax=Streptomyces sp. KR55 TaxID=3457425 RepID=UPI003FD47264
MPYAATYNSPSVTAVRDGWMILHRGTDNRIYFSTNVGTGLIGVDSFPVWQAIQVNGQFQTTWDTPDVTATPEGNVTVAYRGSDGNLYTVEGQVDLYGYAYWHNNRTVLAAGGVGQAASALGPAIVTLSDGEQRLFYNTPDQGHAPRQTFRSSTTDGWNTGGPYGVPGAPSYTAGRPSAAAIGQTLQVAYLQADFQGRPIPSTSEGYGVQRTAYDGGMNQWAWAGQLDEQGWRVNDAPAIDIGDEGNRIRFIQLMHEANMAAIGRIQVAYRDVTHLY